MLSKTMNDRLTQVGPGTPGGAMLRYYWYPVAGSVELDDNPVKKVRLLGEDLVLYKDRSGNLGLIDEPCPHRRVSMEYGIPEQEGLRCPYHGWLFNHEGRCLEQPAEPWNSTFKDRIQTKAYLVQELGGLVFAYLGPQPAPLLPRWDMLVWDNAIRHIGLTMLPCNWLQAMENSLDPLHVEWLHGHYHKYVYQRMGQPVSAQFARKHLKIGFDRFEFGLIKRRVIEGNTEEDDPWRIGHPVVFPHILRTGGGGASNFQYRVPVDDTHTLHVTYTAHRPGIPLPPQESVPVYQLPMYDEQGKYLTEVVLVQDFFAWASQGPVAERDKERLGQSDIGVIMLRDLLQEQIERVERGQEPMGLVRDASRNVQIDLPDEEHMFDARQLIGGANRYAPERLQASTDRFSPLLDTLRGVYEATAKHVERGEPLLTPPHRPATTVEPGTHRALELVPRNVG
ncbi:MAG: Rieske 2Fe-2S domain-containing protein [Chloroflexota bacterium]